MTEEKIYRTDFINDRSSEVPIFDYNGKFLFAVLPKTSAYLEAWDPTTTWARWKEVQFLADGSVKSIENKEWENPYRRGWTLTLINDTHATKVLRIDDEMVRVFPGLQRDAPIPLHDPLIFSKSVRWYRETVKEPDPKFPAYLIEVVKDLKKITPRGIREVQKLKALMKTDAARLADKEIQKRAANTGLNINTPSEQTDEGETSE